MIEIPTLQTDVAHWLAHNFPARNPLTVVAGTVEEAGELCELIDPTLAQQLAKIIGRLSRAAVKLDQGIRGTEAEWLAEIDKELGDLMIKMCDVADYYKRDLERAIASRWETVRARDWQADQQGHGMPDAHTA